MGHADLAGSAGLLNVRRLGSAQWLLPFSTRHSLNVTRGTPTMNFKLCMMLSLAALGACGDGGDVQSTPVPFQTLDIPAPPAFTEGTYDLRTQPEWAAAWASSREQFFGQLGPPTTRPPPTVDFQKDSVVGVSLGVGTRCYVPTIVDVSAKPMQLLVKYRSSGPSGPVSLSCAHPSPLVAFATVPKFDGTVVFVRVDN